MTKSSHFQKYCEKAIAKLSEEDVEQFKATTREDERIKMLYDIAKTIPVIAVNDGKSFEKAQAAKNSGNKFFAAKKYAEALNEYNRGIISCPQDTDNGKELLTILISNRSATFFEQEEYRKVFDDIDYVLAVGSYPQKLHYKIWLRKAKCYDALNNEKYAEETYDLALSSLKHAELDEKSLAKKVAEIQELRKNKKTSSLKNHEVIPVSNSDVFTGGNKEYVSAHKNIYFDFDPLLGRFARALENIDTGVIIVEENPHCAVVSQENCLINCQYCCLSTMQPIACPYCGHVVFCSLNCERKATFHRLECKVQPILFHSGASINCSMALRIISQKPHGFFQQKKKLLKDFLKDNCKKVPIKNQIYRSDDYVAAFFLCRNEHLRKKGELVHYSVMAIFLLRLLKFAGYFGANVKDDVLTEEENFIASLILRHLQILQFNSHEISEVRNVAVPNIVDGIENCYKSEYIGAGLYPTLALFNHSCDPSIVRYNIGNRMVVRTIKPVRAGDIIYENYGPLYTTMTVEERRATLQERYWFECFCSPCQEEWPLFDNMNPNQIKIGCQTENCPFEFTLYRDDFCPYITCDYCNSITKIFPCLRGLSQLATLLPKAENLYSTGNTREAMQLFMEAIETLYKYSKPPCPDMVKVQQRLKTLFVHLGNKQVGYVQNL